MFETCAIAIMSITTLRNQHKPKYGNICECADVCTNKNSHKVCVHSFLYSNNFKTDQSKEHLTITLILAWLFLGPIPADRICILSFEKLKKFSFTQSFFDVLLLTLRFSGVMAKIFSLSERV